MYSLLNGIELQKGNFSLKSIDLKDMEAIRIWRNAQIDYLRQTHPISREEQLQYFETNIEPDFRKKYPNQILISFFQGEKHIGYGGLVHIDWEHSLAEVSFLLDSQKAQDIPFYKNAFSIFLSLLKKLAFQELRLKTLHTETYDIRPYHVEILEAAGFEPTQCDPNAIDIQGKQVDILFHILTSHVSLSKN